MAESRIVVPATRGGDAMQTTIESIDNLEEILSRPDEGLIEFVRSLTGDLVVLGVGGKMGPTLARMASRATEAAGVSRRVIGVSSFSQPGLRDALDASGIETHQADLLAPGAVEKLPGAENVIYMVGRKFGSTGAEWNTWATNVLVAGRVAEQYAKSRIVAFSSGNVYPFVPIDSGGVTEAARPDPVGEYAMSCLGRERVFDYFSNEHGARVAHYRLNYAVELRYGIVVDVATRILDGKPVDVSNGYVNFIWQRYANSVALRCLGLATSPPAILNVTGLETISIRELAMRLGERLNRPVTFSGQESTTALLSNASRCHELFGSPEVDADTIVTWVSDWLLQGGVTLDKPTHFETRDGKF
jgi:hypothetical protein